MKATLLGTGSALPTGDRYQAGLVVGEPSAPRPLLVDCGAGAIHRLAQAGYDLAAVETVLLTHGHLDHVADLPSLLKARAMRGAETATVVGPPGTEEYVAPLLAVDGLTDRIEVRVREHEGSPGPVAGRDVEACETVHSAPGFAYRIDDALTVSGDTEASADVAALADGSRVLVHDCAYPDEARSNHATPAALGETLAGVDVERVYLTHLYPAAATEAERMRRTVAERVDASVRVATDLETLAASAGGGERR